MIKKGFCALILLYVHCCVLASGRMESTKTDATRAGAFSARLETGMLFAGVSGISYPLFNSSALYNFSEEEFKPVNAKIHNYEDIDDWTCLLSSDFMFDLNYLFENDVEIYLGSPFYDNDREGLTTGIVKTFKDKSRLDSSLFIGGMNVWKDPYLLNVKRDQTSQLTLGIQELYSQIGGTGLDLLFKLKNLKKPSDCKI